MFSKIQNPETGNWVNANGVVGKRVLRNFVQQSGGMFNFDPCFLTTEPGDWREDLAAIAATSANCTECNGVETEDWRERLKRAKAAHPSKRHVSSLKEIWNQQQGDPAFLIDWTLYPIRNKREILNEVATVAKAVIDKSKNRKYLHYKILNRLYNKYNIWHKVHQEISKLIFGEDVKKLTQDQIANAHADADEDLKISHLRSLLYAMHIRLVYDKMLGYVATYGKSVYRPEMIKLYGSYDNIFKEDSYDPLLRKGVTKSWWKLHPPVPCDQSIDTDFGSFDSLLTTIDNFLINKIQLTFESSAKVAEIVEKQGKAPYPELVFRYYMEVDSRRLELMQEWLEELFSNVPALKEYRIEITAWWYSFQLPILTPSSFLSTTSRQ